MNISSRKKTMSKTGKDKTVYLKPDQTKKSLVLGLRASWFFIFVFSANMGYAQTPAGMPFSKGETVSYEIKKLKVTVGQATLVFEGEVDVSGQRAMLVTFTAQGFKFYDKELIYLDPATFFPLKIERDLDILGKKETITEFYDTQRGKVRIVKTANGKTAEQVIESGKRFDNIYGFIYRYRRLKQFKEGEEFYLHLPTRDVVFEITTKKKFKAAGREFDAYFMSSIPKKYKVWFDSGNRKIPLMISGVLGFGNTSMIMTDYQSNKAP